ncbi:uncharacterized protein LOC116426387 [Nomia melanderi]|uniref:uncharacterized protein LOC116426387 n=1 Tax=Nomia melanderi TaxID=2448451 RepID=UPI0013044B9F|nr:uncharacterized protein LOC116426387 [Nomia melanderi]
MTAPSPRNPMYALCLLAAICVRQYVQTRSDQPLTKGLSVQPPSAVLTKPNESCLKSVITDSTWKAADEKYQKIKQADSLVECVQNFYKRVRRFVQNAGTNVTVSKTSDAFDLNGTSNVLDSILYLTSTVGTKWIA